MTTLTDHDVFWLVRYAHNKLAPLFAEAKAIEPSIQVTLELQFANPDSVHQKVNSVAVASHWDRAGMFQHTYGLTDAAAIDRLAEKVRADVDKLKVGAAA